MQLRFYFHEIKNLEVFLQQVNDAVFLGHLLSLANENTTYLSMEGACLCPYTPR